MTAPVSTLTGPLLARAVAMALGKKVYRDGSSLAATWIVEHANGGIASFGEHGWRPDQSWQHGGPLLELQAFYLEFDADGYWVAKTPKSETMRGTTPLQAAMRAIVHAHFGDTMPEGFQ